MPNATYKLMQVKFGRIRKLYLGQESDENAVPGVNINV